MTAVIGILNKNAVAIAADSAVTVSGNNGKKIYNNANKIFTLSKHHPVSIIIYNSANFISTPWEIIIKLYRNQLKEKSFPKLKDYSDDFFKFLKDQQFFSTKETIESFNENLIYHSFEDLSELAIKKAVESDTDLISISSEERISLFRQNIIDLMSQRIEHFKRQEKLLDFQDLSIGDFKSLIEAKIIAIIKNNFKEYATKKIINLFVKLTYEYLKSKIFFGSWTGLVFAGYGDKEIYPTTISTLVGDVFNNKVRFYTDHVEVINDNNTGSIMPFAQRDVIDTIITGISPEIDETLFTTINKFLSGYNNSLIDLLKESVPELADKISNVDIDGVCNEFMKEINNIKKVKHIVPTVDTVSILSKEDLAEMAESLIYLTYLKRRISSGEESVGGPVDVALISKGDGFIWIQRKHYFEEKYNPHFLNNYYK